MSAEVAVISLCGALVRHLHCPPGPGRSVIVSQYSMFSILPEYRWLVSENFERGGSDELVRAFAAANSKTYGDGFRDGIDGPRGPKAAGGKRNE